VSDAAALWPRTGLARSVGGLYANAESASLALAHGATSAPHGATSATVLRP